MLQTPSRRIRWPKRNPDPQLKPPTQVIAVPSPRTAGPENVIRKVDKDSEGRRRTQLIAEAIHAKGGTMTPDQVVANTLLMSAAPEMFTALQAWRRFMSEDIIEDLFGKKCEHFDPNCACCQAWKIFELTQASLTKAQTGNTREVQPKNHSNT